MAMEKDFIVHETHFRPITAIGSSFARREIYLGYEDGIVKSVEVDTCKHVQTYAGKECFLSYVILKAVI